MIIPDVGDIVLVEIGYSDYRYVVESITGGVAGRRLHDDGSLGGWMNLSGRQLVVLGRYEPPVPKSPWWTGIVRIIESLP